METTATVPQSRKQKYAAAPSQTTAVDDVARQNNLTPVQSKTGSTHILHAVEQGLKARASMLRNRLTKKSGRLKAAKGDRIGECIQKNKALWGTSEETDPVPAGGF